MIVDTERAARADEQAKLKVAEEKERLRLRHTGQKLKASELLFAKAREVLRQSAKKSRAPDAAKMFLIASTLGNEALGLEGSAPAGHFGLHPIAPPNITVVHYRDDQSDVVDAIKRQFLRDNPDDPAAAHRADPDELRETADADAQLLGVWRDGNRSSNEVKTDQWSRTYQEFLDSPVCPLFCEAIELETQAQAARRGAWSKVQP